MKIISGGQTGVDRAALDVALELNFTCGGWCPKGRKAEDGPIPSKYPLQETKSDQYPERTRKNVQDSDGTLILTLGEADKGTKLTQDIAEKLKKPCLVVDLKTAEVRAIVDWANRNGFHILNVAGPRESSNPGIYQVAKRLINQVITEILAKEC